MHQRNSARGTNGVTTGQAAAFGVDLLRRKRKSIAESQPLNRKSIMQLK